MRKILVAVNGLKLDMHTLDFACYLGRLTRSTITGVFLENQVAEYRPVLKNAYYGTYLDWEVNEASPEHVQKMKIIETNIGHFKEACSRREVNCAIQRDEGAPAREIIAESRFADLLILDAETSFNKHYEGSPTPFVKEILQNAECPVIIAPETFERIDEIVFCYDGSSSSFYSVKQFDYLLPELKNKNVSVVEVTKDEALTIEEKDKVKDWFERHYSNVEFHVLKGEAKDELFSFLLQRKNAFIIMGSYGRGTISRFFKSSTAERVLKTTNLPVFITHL